MTREAYRKKLKLRMILGAFVALAGLATILLTFYEPVRAILNETDFVEGFYVGSGGGLTGAGLATVAICLVYLKKENLFEKDFVKETDERNRYLEARAAQISYYVCMYTTYLATLVAGIVNSTVFVVLLSLLGFMVVVFFVSLIICRKVY